MEQNGTGSKKRAPQRKWKKAHCASIAYDERKEIVSAFKEKCKRENVAQSAILRKAVLDFLNEKGEGE